MIKINLKQFIHDHFWFGWYTDHYTVLDRDEIRWYQNYNLRWVPMVSRKISLDEFQEKYIRKVIWVLK